MIKNIFKQSHEPVFPLTHSIYDKQNYIENYFKKCYIIINCYLVSVLF